MEPDPVWDSDLESKHLLSQHGLWTQRQNTATGDPLTPKGPGGVKAHGVGVLLWGGRKGWATKGGREGRERRGRKGEALL